MVGAALFALVPWLVMVIGLRHGGVTFESSAELAAVCAVLLAVWCRRYRHSAAFESASISIFVGLALASHYCPGAIQHDLNEYGRAITACALALSLLGSLALRPFTSQYTRELVPSTFLSAQAFRRANVIDTLAWVTTATCVGASFVVATALSGALVNTMFNWLVPMALSIAAARRFSRRWSAIQDDLGGIDSGAERTLMNLAHFFNSVERRTQGPSTRPKLQVLHGGSERLDQ